MSDMAKTSDYDEKADYITDVQEIDSESYVIDPHAEKKLVRKIDFCVMPLGELTKRSLQRYKAAIKYFKLIYLLPHVVL